MGQRFPLLSSVLKRFHHLQHVRGNNLVMDSPPCSTSAPHSLYQIYRTYPRERLEVHPIRWTGRHLEILQCTFSSPSLPHCKPTRHVHPGGDRRAAAYAFRFESAYGLGFRRQCMWELLVHRDGPLLPVESVAPTLASNSTYLYLVISPRQ